MVPSSMTKEQTMSPLRVRMIEDMKLAGLAATTQEIYLQAVRSLAKHYNRSPELLAEEEVRRYLLDVRERNARGSFKTSYYGIQFFYRNTLGLDWALFKKRSGSPSRGGCRRRFPMPKCGAFSARGAIRDTAAVSAGFTAAACGSARPLLFPSPPSTRPVASCASSARATRNGSCLCPKRGPRAWVVCARPTTTAIRAGSSPMAGEPVPSPPMS